MVGCPFSKFSGVSMPGNNRTRGRFPQVFGCLRIWGAVAGVAKRSAVKISNRSLGNLTRGRLASKSNRLPLPATWWMLQLICGPVFKPLITETTFVWDRVGGTKWQPTRSCPSDKLYLIQPSI